MNITKKKLEIRFNKMQLKRGNIIKIIELLLQELEEIKNIKLDKIKNKKELLIILKEIQYRINHIKNIT